MIQPIESLTSQYSSVPEVEDVDAGPSALPSPSSIASMQSWT